MEMFEQIEKYIIFVKSEMPKYGLFVDHRKCID